MNEAPLRTFEQIKQFPSGSTPPIGFTASGDDGERYAHISCPTGTALIRTVA